MLDIFHYSFSLRILLIKTFPVVTENNQLKHSIYNGLLNLDFSLLTFSLKRFMLMVLIVRDWDSFRSILFVLFFNPYRAMRDLAKYLNVESCFVQEQTELHRD